MESKDMRIRVSNKLRQDIETVAVKKGITMSALVRKVLEIYIAEEKKANRLPWESETDEQVAEIFKDKDGWILCEKGKLPDEEVLCCDTDGNVFLGYVYEKKRTETGFCAINSDGFITNIIVWQPKPKPYKGGTNK